MQTAISVPDLPVASIRNRRRDANVRHRSSVSIACALAAITVLGSGTVLASMMFSGVRIWLSGDKAALTMHSFAYVQNPKADDLRRVTADATFPVVLPVGIPKGMHMTDLFFSPADHPNFIEVTYRNAKTDARSGQFLLFDSSTVNHGAPTLPNGEELQVGQVRHWNVGQETVVVFGAGQQAGMKAAMSGITPAESLAQTLPMLYRITVLGVQDRLADAADVIAPSEGRTALLDREDLGQIKIVAQSYKKRVMFVRATMFDNLPFVAGKPDFANQRSHRITETAVSAGGVHAIAAVLALNVCGKSGERMGSGFTCEMLINERSGRAYWIWVLPLNPSTPPTRYVVDSTTFHVLQGR
ncbi:MAG TPA: hypothetical protein VMS32_01605 [Verrucomicrobiae bacterium]|nr:hypothetical protein [Verrucomicrobiae bacterium]